MNIDLISRYLVETREILFSDELACPKQLLQVRQARAVAEVTEEFTFTSPAEAAAYRDLRELLLPSEARAHLLEFLLERFEPEIVADCGSIETALRQLGCWMDRRKTKLDQILSFFDSLQLLWRVATLVATSLRVPKIEEATK